MFFHFSLFSYSIICDKCFTSANKNFIIILSFFLPLLTFLLHCLIQHERKKMKKNLKICLIFHQLVSEKGGKKIQKQRFFKKKNNVFFTYFQIDSKKVGFESQSQNTIRSTTNDTIVTLPLGYHLNSEEKIIVITKVTRDMFSFYFLRNKQNKRI